MAITQIRGSKQIIDGSIANAQINAAAAIATSKLADGANFILRGGTVAFTADQSMGGFKLTNVATPVSTGDAANKAYVDARASGLDPKGSVKVVSVANLTLSGEQTIDGVLTSTDRILVTGQTTASENGIYVTSSGAWTRSTDADSDAEVTAGMHCFIEEGTNYADTGWILETNDPITVGTTSLTFSQYTGAGDTVAGAGLTKTGNTLDVGAGNGIAVAADSVAVNLDGTTLAVSGSGLKLSDLTDAYLLVGNVSNIATGVAMSGDATLANTGALTLAANVLKEADIVSKEVPTGAIDSSNTTYTLANTPVVGTEEVYLNGILQEPGSGNDYTISGLTITYLTAPETGSKLLVSYLK